MEIILYNSAGCELDRIDANSAKNALQLLAFKVSREDWVLKDGDTIKVKE